jgi:hypothetical protein
VLAAAQAPAPCARPLRHAAYTQQPPLSGLAPGEVAAVLEVVVGRAGGAVAPSAITGRCDDEAAVGHWAPRPLSAEGGLAGGAPACESLGQLSGCVLAKLIVDTWLRAGSAAAAPLVLHMLQQALSSTHACVRARAFDVVYNLSIHAAMLVTGDAAGQAEARERAEPPPAAERSEHGSPRSSGALSPAAAGGLAAPSPPPGLANYSYARPQSPVGAPRTRAAVGHPAPQLPSPRIHLPPQVQGPSAACSGGSSGSSGSSPRLPHPGQAANGSASALSPAQQAPAQPALLPPSPRSRLGRGADGEAAQCAEPGVAAVGSSSGAASQPRPRDDAAAPPAAQDSSGGGGGGRAGAGAFRDGPAPVQIEFEAWLRRPLFELLCMLTQVRPRSDRCQRSPRGQRSPRSNPWGRVAA